MVSDINFASSGLFSRFSTWALAGSVDSVAGMKVLDGMVVLFFSFLWTIWLLSDVVDFLRMTSGISSFGWNLV